MKKLLITLAILLAQILFGQTLDFDHVNANNIVEFLKNTDKGISTASNTTIAQIGNNNNAGIRDRSAKTDIILQQTGDFNNFLFTNARRDTESKMKINIKGDNNYLDITGSNSISNGLQINLKTNDKMIFMRNY